jgi:hypothetical protein
MNTASQRVASLIDTSLVYATGRPSMGDCASFSNGTANATPPSRHTDNGRSRASSAPVNKLRQLEKQGPI